MSELWKEAEEKLKELEEALPKLVTQDKDIFDSVANKKLGELEVGKIKGRPEIKEKKVYKMDYTLSLKLNGKIIGEIIGIVAENESISNLEYVCDWKKKISNVIAYAGNELILSLSFFDKNVRISCYDKKASEIVDKIAKKYKLI